MLGKPIFPANSMNLNKIWNIFVSHAISPRRSFYTKRSYHISLTLTQKLRRLEKNYHFQLTIFITTEFNTDLLLKVLAHCVPWLSYTLKYNVLCLNIKKVAYMPRWVYPDIFLREMIIIHIRRCKILRNACIMIGAIWATCRNLK